jgi:hypothetical protein
MSCLGSFVPPRQRRCWPGPSKESWGSKHRRPRAVELKRTYAESRRRVERQRAQALPHLRREDQDKARVEPGPAEPFGAGRLSVCVRKLPMNAGRMTS